MNEVLALALAAAGGSVLGTLFFGGLWWTVERGARARMPALWFSASLLLRSSTAVVGFYLISGGEWPRLVSCLFGFLLARRGVLWRTRPARYPASPPSKDRHAPQS